MTEPLRDTLTQERVLHLFDYREDGMLVWKNPPKHRRERTGRVAGCSQNRGYWRIKILGKHYLLHRLVYLYHHGYFPEGKVDHKDRKKMHSAVGNLREASTMCNSRNAKQPITNTSGVKGVSKTKTSTKWSAHITLMGKHIYLGCSTCLVEAACLRLAAEQSLNWEGCESTSPAYLYVKSYVKGRL